MGANTLAANTGLTVENAQRGIEILNEKFPNITQWCTDNADFAVEHNGQIRTILGDTLFAQDRGSGSLASQGANQVVQNYSSVVLVHGFYNVIREAIKAGYSIRPELVIHDASINICDIHLFPIIFPFYKKNFQDFLKSKCDIVFKYDLEVLPNFMDACFINNISVEGEADHYELSGTNRALKLMLEKFDLNDMPYEILEQDGDFTEDYHHRYLDALQSEGETSIQRDHSWNRIVFKFTRSTDEMLNERIKPIKNRLCEY